MQKKWITKEEKQLIKCAAFNVWEKTCVASDDGREHTFFAMKSREWCNIIPVTEDGKVVMVKQFRIGLGDYTLEFPGGIVDNGEEPHVAALRELEEETGYAPVDGFYVKALGWSYPNPAILNNKCHSFAVGPVKLKQSQKLDAGEMVEIVEVKIENIPDLIKEGHIRHALMLNSVFFLIFSDWRTSSGATDFVKKALDGYTSTDAD